MSDTTVEALQDQIRDLENTIREKERILISKRRDLGHSQQTFSETEITLAEAEKQFQAAQEELRAAEAERQSLLPQYERAQQNKDSHLQASEYKKEIAAAEAQLVAADARIRELETKLKSVSATYKNERERRMLMINRVSALVDDLRSAVELKIALTLPLEEANDAPDAKACLQLLAELTREREAAIAHWTRHGRELEAIVEMKRERALELKLESERNIELMRAAKDDEIRLLVEKFEAERTALLKDIESMKLTNEKQLLALRKTKLVSDKPSIIQSEKSDLSVPSRRDLATPTEKILFEKSKDLEKEKDSLNEQIRLATIERQKLLTATKDLRRLIETEEQKYSQSIHNLENQLLNERHEAARLEKENKKLKEICDTLAVTLRSGFMPPAQL
jgi:hypothetical protein